MPFVYRKKLAGIDRSSRKTDEEIKKSILASFDDIVKTTRDTYVHVSILPYKFKDPSIKDADPRKFLALHAIRMNNLDWYDVEFWLDNIKLRMDNPLRFYISPISAVFLDERRMLYKCVDGRYSAAVIYNRKV